MYTKSTKKQGSSGTLCFKYSTVVHRKVQDYCGYEILGFVCYAHLQEPTLS